MAPGKLYSNPLKTLPSSKASPAHNTWHLESFRQTPNSIEPNNSCRQAQSAIVKNKSGKHTRVSSRAVRSAVSVATTRHRRTDINLKNQKWIDTLHFSIVSKSGALERIYHAGAHGAHPDSHSQIPTWNNVTHNSIQSLKKNYRIGQWANLEWWYIRQRGILLAQLCIFSAAHSLSMSYSYCYLYHMNMDKIFSVNSLKFTPSFNWRDI